MGEVLQQVLIVSAGVILAPFLAFAAVVVLALACGLLDLLIKCGWAIMCLPYRLFKEFAGAIRENGSRGA